MTIQRALSRPVPLVESLTAVLAQAERLPTSLVRLDARVCARQRRVEVRGEFYTSRVMMRRCIQHSPSILAALPSLGIPASWTCDVQVQRTFLYLAKGGLLDAAEAHAWLPDQQDPDWLRCRWGLNAARYADLVTAGYRPDLDWSRSLLNHYCVAEIESWDGPTRRVPSGCGTRGAGSHAAPADWFAAPVRVSPSLRPDLHFLVEVSSGWLQDNRGRFWLGPFLDHDEMYQFIGAPLP